MVCRHDGHGAELLPLAAQPGDSGGLAQQSFHCRGAERDDYPGLDQINLCEQIRQASLHLLRRRFTIAHRLSGCVGTAFQNVGDVNRAAREAHRLNDFGQQLAGFADERFALLIFIRPWRFADKQHRRINGADAEHDILPRCGEMRAFPADHGAGLQLSHGGLFRLEIKWRGSG